MATSTNRDLLRLLQAYPEMLPAPPISGFTEALGRLLEERAAHRNTLVLYNATNEHYNLLAETGMEFRDELLCEISLGALGLSAPQESDALEARDECAFNFIQMTLTREASSMQLEDMSSAFVLALHFKVPDAGESLGYRRRTVVLTGSADSRADEPHHSRRRVHSRRAYRSAPKRGMVVPRPAREPLERCSLD